MIAMKINYKIQVVLIFVLIFAGCAGNRSDENNEKETITELSPEEFRSSLSSTPDAVLIDVRKPEEVAEGKIEGAVNIDYTDSSFTAEVGKLDKTKPYFLYCKTGKRSTGAADKMKIIEFQDVYVLEGGLVNWQERGLETVKPE